MPALTPPAVPGRLGAPMVRLGSIVIQTLIGLLLVAGVTLGVGFFARHHVLRLAGRLPPFTHAVGEQFGTRVEMRDGVSLSTQIVLPDRGGPWPTVILRNPYNLLNAFTLGCELFARYGYACVHQDVRGRMGSEGEWYPLVHEREDGLDLFAWLRERDFQNGRWALFGMSYLAGAQWAVADALPNEVETMVSMVFGVDTHRVMYERGLFRPDVFTAWAALMPDEHLALWNGWAYARMLRHRPPMEADRDVLGRIIPWYRSWIAAESASDPLWSEPPFTHFLATPTRVQVPVMMIGGYYDPFFDAQRRDFERLRTRAESRFLVGPWQHLQENAADFPLPESLGLGGQARLVLDWLDHHLKDAPLHQALGVIESYDLGAGGWRRRIELPPPPTSQARFHLAELESASDCPGGRLGDLPAPSDAPPARYVHDPEDPYPAEGGAAALSFAFRTFPSVTPGARRRSPRCEREDVLRFSSPPLATALHLAGSLAAHLRVSTTAEDTAFGFELLVQPPGDDGWYHVRQGFGTLSATIGRTATPGEVLEVELDAWPIEWTFPAGARLRVEVRSSSFPLYASHPNRPGPWAEIATSVVAEQRLHPGSWVELPLRPPDEPVLSSAALGTVRATMACTFEIDLPGSAAEIVQRAEAMVTDAGGSFSGTDASGSYKLKIAVGAIEGTYTILHDAIRFEITKKPVLVPCGAIESFIRDRLKSA